MKAILYRTDGSEQEVQPADSKEFTLQEMYGLIGCDMVEHVHLAEGKDGEESQCLWVDEEGLLKSGWVINAKATELYRAAYPKIPPEELAIAGNALFVDNIK